MKFLGQKNITQSDINCPAITFPVKYTECIIDKLGEGESKVYGPRKRAFMMKVHKNRSTGRVVFTSVKKFFDQYDVLPGVTVQLFEDDQGNFWMLPERKDFCAPWENAGADLIMKKQVVDSELRGSDKVFIWLTSKPALIRQIHTSNTITVLADNGKFYSFQASVERLPKVTAGLEALCCWKWSRVNDFVAEVKVQIGDYLFLWSDVQHRLHVSCQSNPAGTVEPALGPAVPPAAVAISPHPPFEFLQATSSSQKAEVMPVLLPPFAPLQPPPNPMDCPVVPKSEPNPDADDAKPPKDLSGLNLLAAVAVEDAEKSEAKPGANPPVPGATAAPTPTTAASGAPAASPTAAPGTAIPNLTAGNSNGSFPPGSREAGLQPPDSRGMYGEAPQLPHMYPPSGWPQLPPRDQSVPGYQPSSPSDELAGASLPGQVVRAMAEMSAGSPKQNASNNLSNKPRDGAGDAPPPLPPALIEHVSKALSSVPRQQLASMDMNQLVTMFVTALNSSSGGDENTANNVNNSTNTTNPRQFPAGDTPLWHGAVSHSRKRSWPEAAVDGSGAKRNRGGIDMRSAWPGEPGAGGGYGEGPGFHPRWGTDVTMDRERENHRDRDAHGPAWGPTGLTQPSSSKSGGYPGGYKSYFQNVWRYEAAVERVMQLNEVLYHMIKERHTLLREIKDGEFQSKYKSLMRVEQDLFAIRKQLQGKYMEAAEIISSSDF